MGSRNPPKPDPVDDLIDDVRRTFQAELKRALDEQERKRMTKSNRGLASVMLVFPHEKRRYRIVTVADSTPGYVDQVKIDVEDEDSVGDKYWRTIHQWRPKQEPHIAMLLSAVTHAMNPNAMIANDAELEGRTEDATKILAQGSGMVLSAGRCAVSNCVHVAGHQGDHHASNGMTIGFSSDPVACDHSGCRLFKDHLQNHIDADDKTIMCSRCERPAGHDGKCFEAHP